MTDGRIVCLLPARNAAEDLPGYFRSVAPVADAVVALDDGSSDDTAEILAADPLVKILLRNPRRDTYRGWDDSANRRRLLEAAGELEPAWVISLDADERLDSDDARALRAFVEREAASEFAYGFTVFRMIGDLTQYDRARLRVYRLFGYQSGQRFPGERLHFVPVPHSIPRERWLDTTVRIQHLASLTEARRRARFEKYLEADPGNRFQADYTNLLEPPGELKRWERRPPGLSVFAGSASGNGALPLRSTSKE